MKDDLLDGLPGEWLVRKGLNDLAANHETVEACLAQIARPRLQRAQLMPAEIHGVSEPELRLYALLRQQEGDAYSRYNALLRELVSFENALDARMKRTEDGERKSRRKTDG